jgi:hypothetical protein
MGQKTDDVLNSVSSSKGTPEVAFRTTNPSGDRDGLVLVDITVKDGIIARIKPSSEGEEEEEEEEPSSTRRKGCACPPFAISTLTWINRTRANEVETNRDL